MPLVRTVLVLLLCLAAPATATAQRAPLRGLDAYIEQAMKDWEVPGLAISVVRNDSVIYARGFGVRELGRPEPVDEQTLFAIASTTKAFTAAALGMLVDDKKLAWDDRVTAHLPWFQLADPYVTRELTVRDLLSHRVGIERSDNLWLAAPLDRTEVLRRARLLPTTSSFRYRYGYNNIMFIAAGELAGAVAGMSWDDFIEQRIFQPLGMSRSTTRMDVLARRGNVASPHTPVDGQVRAAALVDYSSVGGGGAIFSSARDMAQWLRLHLGGGEYQGSRLLQPATLKEMYTPQTIIRSDSVDERMFPTTHFRAYGLGWILQDYHGLKLVHHSGWLNYTRTQVGMIPARNIGVFVTANLSSSNLQAALMYRVLDALLGLPARDWSADYLELARRAQQRAAAAPADSGRVRGTRPSLDLEAYAGTYRNAVYGDVRITLEQGRLMLRYAPEYVAPLEHWHYDTFRALWERPDFGRDFLSFTLDRRARVAALQLDGFGEFRRVDEPSRRP